MAVYKKTYRRTRAAYVAVDALSGDSALRFEDLHRSRFLTLFFIASFIYPLICALIIYVQHNVSALGLVGMPGANRLIAINVTFFMSVLGAEHVGAVSGPSSAPAGVADLANNALSLYLARPFSRSSTCWASSPFWLS